MFDTHPEGYLGVLGGAMEIMPLDTVTVSDGHRDAEYY